MKRFFVFLFVFLLLSSAAAKKADADIVKKWNTSENNLTIWNTANNKTLAIIHLDVENEIDLQKKTFTIYSYTNYTFSDLTDFITKSDVKKGKYGFHSKELYLQKNVSYNVTINDYQQVNHSDWNATNSTWNNWTESQLIGNHTETRSRLDLVPFPVSSSQIKAGKTYVIIEILRKRAELGEVSIRTNETFFGIVENNMTWYNVSWSKKAPILVNNTGNATTLTDFQVNVNITYDSDMNSDFSDIRVVNETSGLAIPLWNETIVNSSYANIWFNASSIPASVWTNSTFYLYYSNPSSASVSNGTNAFQFFEDFKGDLSKWDNITGAPEITNGELVLTGDEVRAKTSVSGSVVIHIRNKASVTNSRANFGAANSGIASSINPIDDAIYLQKYYLGAQYYVDNSNETTTTQTQIGAYDTDYHDYDFYFTSGVDIVFKTDKITVGTHTTNLPDEPLKVNLLQNSGENPGTAYYDNIFVRKYASPEPTAQLGPEESIPSEFVQVMII